MRIRPVPAWCLAIVVSSLGCGESPIEGSGSGDSETSTDGSTSDDSTTGPTSAGPTSSTDGTTEEPTTFPTSQNPTSGTDPTDTTDPGVMCGDGIVDPGEECDLGADNSDNGLCTTECKMAVCGDMLIGPGESCDDGNLDEGDGCDGNCVLESCGNGELDMGEECDDGNADDNDECLNSCTAAVCGDGVVLDGMETCDDGNADNTDACTSLCLAPACDDNIVSGDESDVDCGGSCMQKCELDQACGGDGDCATQQCFQNTCVPPAAPPNCKELLALDPNADSGMYTIDPDGLGGMAPFDVYCQMKFGPGGWTMVLKADGEADTFIYGAELWTNTDTHQPGNADLNHSETKLASYHTVPFDQILVAMEGPIINNDPLVLNFQVLDIAGASLHALISADVYVPSMAGKPAWLGLVTGSELQTNCNREGLNAVKTGMGPEDHHRVRIGIIANGEDNCDTPDSRLGIGAAGSTLLPDGTPSVGNAYGHNNQNQQVQIPAYGVVFVR